MTCKLTRQEAKQAIKKKQVSVDDVIVCKPEMKIDTTKQLVQFQGNALLYEPYIYYMLNKPAGVVSATKDNLHRTVIDLIDDNVQNDLFPVGRLDIDTEGLLLITNDGELGHRLTSPAHHVDKRYEVIVNGALDDTLIEKFATGLDIGEEKPTLPATLTILETGERSRAYITIQEGKFHQVKRMFSHCGYPVIFLKRIQMGPLILDSELAPGEYRRLSEEEVQALKDTKK
jgi:16S rRNA pseudouridine516 synthase